MANTISSFTGGDLVVSISGDGDGSGTYTDNQASPITLEELTTSGAVVGQLVLPQTASGVNNAISGEYGSSSEGSLELSGDGQSLTIAGYGINAATYNAGESNGNNTYGNAALAQSTSVQGTGVTAVPRVVADISYNGNVDTSTSLYNIYNTQNPRSVVTANGSSFYLSGQGIKSSTNQGVFLANDGSSTYSAIYTGVDTRTAELYNGTLYVSSDSSQAKGTGNIASYGISPTGATTPAPLPGITGKITLTAAQENTVDASAVGTSVDLSPENFFFANANTLYVADSGNPKGGTVGDGGLQKWTYNGSTWNLQYTVSGGLNLVSNTATAGTTGLIGLTGTTNADGTVSLYATNATIGDLDPTYVYGVTDTLSATTPGSGETFTQLVAAATDTNIRGIAFAPTCFATGTRIATARGEVAVEDLAVGDVAVTASGGLRPIRWIGHRVIAADAMSAECAPVRIQAGAFGVGLPARDLMLSPGHPVLVGADADNEGGHLVPVMCLVNGTTICRIVVESVTYWHVELDAHDILLAEGLAAESYLDWGDRAFFTDGSDHALANPDFVVPGLAGRCRPVALEGVIVESERDRLDALFALRLDAACSWPTPEALAF